MHAQTCFFRMAINCYISLIALHMHYYRRASINLILTGVKLFHIRAHSSTPKPTNLCHSFFSSSYNVAKEIWRLVVRISKYSKLYSGRMEGTTCSRMSCVGDYRKLRNPVLGEFCGNISNTFASIRKWLYTFLVLCVSIILWRLFWGMEIIFQLYSSFGKIYSQLNNI